MGVGPAGTALLLIETLNEFMHPGGAFHAGIQPVAKRNGCLNNLVELARRCRGRIPLIYAPICFSRDYAELRERDGILAGVKKGRALAEGSFGARFFAEIEPRGDDIVLGGKRGISVFHGTNLDSILRERKIRHLAMAGFLTNVCVESTARSAYDFGYKVAVIADACACNSFEEQTHSEKRTLPYFGRVITTEAFLKEISGGTI